MTRHYRLAAAAYIRGISAQIGVPSLPSELTAAPLDSFHSDHLDRILQIGLAADLPIHYFKRTMPLARVAWALSVLRTLQPWSLLELGSGRGTFLWPLVDAFPKVPVTAIDSDPERAALLKAVECGGLPHFTAQCLDVTALPFTAGQFDVVTILEVLEHIPAAQAALTKAVRVAGRAVLITVPSRPDDNPEHVHLLGSEQLRGWLKDAGVIRCKLGGVPGHLTVLALKGEH